MKTETERLREANAILSEIIATRGVPDRLRRMATAFVQESQDIAKHRGRVLVSDLITPEDVQRHDRIQIEIEVAAADMNARRGAFRGNS